VRDANNNTGAGSVPVTVQNGSSPLAAGFSTPAQGATVSGTITVGMTASGGTAPYTYTLTIDGAQVASSGSNTYSWNTTTSSNASHTLGLTVRDNTGATATATRTVTVQNGGGGTPLGASFTTPAAGATVNGTVTVTMAASGGTGPYTYTLTIDGAQVASGASTTFSWNTAAYSNASHTLGLTVRDGAGATATATRTVTVQNNVGTIGVFITQPSSGATVTGTQWVVIWIENAGAGTKTFTLTAAGQTVATTTDTSNGPVTMPWITTGTPNGPTTLTASVRDANNNTGAGSIPVTVQNGSSPLAAGFSTPAQGATVSGTITVGMTASGGTAPYTYTLTIDGAQVASSGSNTYSWNTTTSSNASHTLGLTVRDNTGATATATRTVTVQNGGGGTPLGASFTTPAAGATVNGTVTVTMAASGGTGPYTYTLTIDGAQVASGASTTFSWNTAAYSNASHTLGLTVRDSAGATATASRTVTVSNGGGGGTLTVAVTTPSPGSTVRGTVWVTIWVDGAAAGNKTYTMTVGGTTVWNETNGDRPASLPWVTTNGTNGTKTLVVTVRDSAGATGTASVTVTVTNP
jgi:hypothetical protein